jgi:hypothetical protein
VVKWPIARGAFLYEKLGKPYLAVADYEALLALDPKDQFSRRMDG